MEYILTCEEMKITEDYTINTIGIPSIVLMETASRCASEEICKGLHTNDAVFVFCGVGNNGADGLCVARILSGKGYTVYVVLADKIEKATELFKKQYEILQHTNVNIEEFDSIKKLYLRPAVIVDALFGIGLKRDVSGAYKDIICWINDNPSKVYSLDVPSGLNATTGLVCGAAVKADITITNQFYKTGLILNDGPLFTGKVIVKDVGIFDYDIENKSYTLDASDISNKFRRRLNGNKGTFGKLLIIAGSGKMPGASILTSRAAFKTGTGMVKTLTDYSNRDIYMHEIPEAMLGFVKDYKDDDYNNDFSWCSACVVGCGMGISDESRKLVNYTIQSCEKPLIIDADGLNIIAEDMSALIARKERGLVTILTPHPLEFSRLFKTDIKEKINQIPEMVKKYAREYGIILVAKDARTIISDGCHTYINTETTPALATAGSGDVLSGIIAALISQQKDAFNGAVYGCLIHSLAGKDAEYEYGDNSVSASDVINAIYRVIN